MPRDTQPLFVQKHLLILGCGYLGQYVAREALWRGMRVTALTRNETHAVALRAQGLGVIVADLASEDWHALAPREVDYVLNCVSSGAASAAARAALSPASASEDKLAARRRSYVDGMRSLTRWLRDAERVGTIVYTSSTSVYPQGGGAVVDEDSPTVPPDTNTRAGILTAAEQRLQRDCPPAPKRWFILRLAGLYGPGRSHLLDQVLKNAPSLGPVSQRLNLVHVEDAAAAIWAAFAAPATFANRVYNVADDAPAPKCEVLTWLAEQVGPISPDSAKTATVSAAQRSSRQVLDRIISNVRLKREIGWQPRYPDYRAGYAKMLSH
ncbi:hypothetical protein AXK12_00270 [Cephaloticoccus capnophilus]|uniref:NAD-dependent epimerase/dehydratase domain-containing protein n=1 Tax=Cephaloticoccus capnophilus TaxID=1548208 RepID=A0A139SKF2_9BACT|nr:NAD-dependent epimerase/dehydratase family protein [Cephaloticoccus capnophilus]KXU35038.1 hypothetical protein AXK12_00270 [Cephaloticoccus capnophilus]